MLTGGDAIAKSGWKLLLGAGLLMLSGCAKVGDVPRFSDLPPTTRPGGVERSKRDPKKYLLVVRLELASVEVPVGLISGSEEIWSYLDEESVREVRTPAMGFNGIRVGRGKEKAWADIAKILKEITGRKLAESSMIAMPGSPVPIVLKSRQRAQTIFVFDEHQTLRGADYPPADYLLTLVCTLDEDDPSKVLLTGLPQIRSSRRRPRFLNQPGGVPVMVSRPDVYSLTELTFQVVIPKNDFLIIGPGPQSGRSTSPGYNFFVKDRDGVEFEMLLIIRPAVFAAPPGRTLQAVRRP